MPKTAWKYRMYLFFRKADVNAGNRAALAAIFTNNGSGQTVDEEMLMFDTLLRFSQTGNEPATVFGISSPVKLSMRDDLKDFLDGLDNSRFAVIANTKRLPGYQDKELIMTNFDVEPNGQIVEFEDVLTYMANEFGLQYIEPPPLEE